MAAGKPKAYSYIRFSSDKQQLGDSLRRQLSMARQWATDHDIELDDQSYRDLGVSAFDRSNEDAALGVFLAAAESGTIKPGSYLLVENLDRLSRAGIIATIDIIRALVSADIKVVLLGDDGRVIDKDSINDLTGILIPIIYAVRAHDESAQKSRRLRAVREERRAQIVNGGVGKVIMTSTGPGWLEVNETRTGFEVIPDKAESVRKVFELTAQGMGCSAITRRANQEGWPSPGTAGHWYTAQIAKLVRNRAVLGEYQPRTTQNGERVPIGDPVPDYYPQIVEEALFQRAQAAKNRKEVFPKRRDRYYRNVFSGVLKCSCGATYTYKNKSDSHGKPKYYIWMCADRVRGLTQCPSWSGRDPNRLDVMLLRAMAQHRFGDIAAQEKATALQDKLLALQATHEETVKQIERLADALIDVGKSPTLIQKLRELEQRREQQDKDLDALTHELKELSRGSNDDEQFAVVEELIGYMDRDDKEAIDYRAALSQRIRAAVDAIYVFEKQSMAAIVWRATEDENVCQWVPLREGAQIEAAMEGRLILPQK